jgi:hypothetical protein
MIHQKKPSPTPPAKDVSFDGLTADLVVADDRGNTTVLPADAEALARYLADCRSLERDASTKKEEPQS